MSKKQFPGKIAVVTHVLSVSEEEYYCAGQMAAKYGADKIIHVVWPEYFMAEQEQMIDILARLASDPEIRALIISNAVSGTNAAVDKLKKSRNDIFIVYCSPQEAPSAVAKRGVLFAPGSSLCCSQTRKLKPWSKRSWHGSGHG